MKGERYFTSRPKLAQAARNGGWLFLVNKNSQSGFAPVNLIKKLYEIVNSPRQNGSLERSTFESAFNQQVIPEKMQSQCLTIPNSVVCDNSVVPPQQLVDSDCNVNDGNGSKIIK